MNISVNKNEMKKIANSMIDNTEALADEIKIIMATIEKIEANWKGADALKHSKVLRDGCVCELNKFQSIINDYAVCLKNVADCYDRLEEIYSTKKIN